ncbi:superkiller protein 3 [Acrodontium crateriforme]|uniref:Superkiller protein 3 n=1 Tax=Acrodontium crateriforme TaxID=150365 RepID=A0AAQ3LYS5_9PEZI|nr:superkiller protein 3 [Acrodontium crateriforme]
MSVKASLKAAKAALDTRDWEKAIAEAKSVLESDSQNYFARLFLARAQEKQGKFDDAAKTYESAANSKPDDAQAWLGLCSVYEAQGSKKVDEYREAVVKVAQIYATADDAHRCQSTIDKFVGFAKQNGTQAQYKRALKVMLPSSSIYNFLEGRFPHPFHTYHRLIEMTEKEEAQRIKDEINVRRTRIGARVGQVTTDVKREVFTKSELEDLYQQAINWATDDEARREYEEKLLDRAYETLTILPLEQKAAKLNQVLDLAEGMVIIKHPFRLAWNLVLETRDLDDLKDLDVNILREYELFFPKSGISKILQGWLSSEISPFPAPPKTEEESESTQKAKDLDPEDRLLLFTEGLSGASQSPFAYRLVSDYYLHLEEHESVVDTTRSGLKVLSDESSKLGMSLQNTNDALNSVLGTALVTFESPRNHPEAKKLFENILERKPHSTPALIGLGLIFEETENFQNAISFLSRALDEDKGNLRVGTELAWCRALCGNYAEAEQALEEYLPLLKADDPRARDLRAQVLYRIGVCVWEKDPSKAARKDRSGAYTRFLSAIKTNVNFAPPYTSLGLYYTDYAKDKKRGRQCFQKAFELSAAETGAAERLAKFFADQGDWDIVEVIAQRVVDSGRAKPPPGSKRKGISWPYSALGVVQMNKQEYQKAIVSFLAALRISPDDYQSYVGLGESYHNSGRYNSALRTFTHALDPAEGSMIQIQGETWFARYMLANVHRELGDYDKAIEGLQSVLKERSSEFGVLLSLLQTYVEKAWRCVDTGLFGQAVASAKEAFVTAAAVANDRPDAFNMWKAVGDACLVFAGIQSEQDSFPVQEIKMLLTSSGDLKAYEMLHDVDSIQLSDLGLEMKSDNAQEQLPQPVIAGVLAYKRAIAACSHDVHAQAVAWYNLGISEQRAYSCSAEKAGKKYLRTAVRCFKRAIELEAGNAEFWNALGVVTTTLNTKVAQHSFVRSLHLNELNAKVWANLGVLYLLQNDYELAHKAFGRSQSTDPDYGHAWVGEGLIALLTGDASQALNHFTHAFEISDSSSLITKRQYALSSFDHLLSTPTASNDLTKLIQPIFALEQLRTQVPKALPYRHLAALLLERVGNHITAIESLTELCALAEVEYEASETLAALARFAQAKSDLARNQLAVQDFQGAAENAETALDLSSDAENSGLDAESHRKLRLSSHLTAGLAFSRLQKSSEAIAMFRTALQESSNNPDVVCLLVKVLWANGGREEKSVAQEQLFECVEKHPEHVGSVTLLGAIAALDDDTDTVEAVKDDLLTLRTKDGLLPSEESEIESLISSFAALSGQGESHILAEAQAAVLLKPDHAQAWLDLAEISGERFAADMALKSSEKAVPPVGEMEPEDLARASVGTIAEAQRGICLAPWTAYGWNALADALSPSD